MGELHQLEIPSNINDSEIPPLKLLTYRSEQNFISGFMNDIGMNKRSRESDGRRRGRESFGIAKDILGIAKMDGGADAPQQKTALLTVQQVVRNNIKRPKGK